MKKEQSMPSGVLIVNSSVCLLDLGSQEYVQMLVMH